MFSHKLIRIMHRFVKDVITIVVNDLQESIHVLPKFVLSRQADRQAAMRRPKHHPLQSIIKREHQNRNLNLPKVHVVK